MIDATYPIRILTEKTGVPTSTIRAWERRYHILDVQRTSSGHRFYTDKDAAYVNQLVACMQQGKTISKAIREVDNRIAQGDLLAVSVEDVQSTQWQYYVDQMLLATARFDTILLNEIYNQAMALLTVDVITDKVLCPTMVILGERWQDRQAGIAEEHFFTTFLRNKLGARLHHQANIDGPLLVVACLPNERHELGILLLNLYLQSHGYRVTFLGADLPLSQLPLVAEQAKAQAIILSSTTTQLSTDELLELEQLLGKLTVPVMLGGSASLDGQLVDSNLHLLGSNFQQALQVIRALVPSEW